MGMDSHIAIFDTKDFSEECRERDTKRYEALLKGDTDSEFSHMFEAGLDSIRKLSSTLEELDKQENGKELDVDSIYYNLSYYPLHGNGSFNSFWCGKGTRVERGKISEFLEKHSERAAYLWNKLVGNWNRNYKNSVDTAQNFRIDGKEYELSDVEFGGFLQGEEIKELAEELRPIIQHTDDFYQSLDGKYRRRAKSNRPIERVYGITEMIGPPCNDTMTIIYHFD